MDFKQFADAVHARFEQMKQHAVFVTDVTGDEIWAFYLASFPEGSNPIFRERTEHDCSCCRNFIKNLGRLVAIDTDGQRMTVWDTAVGLSGAYGVVADEMMQRLLHSKITSLYRTKERSYGAVKTYEDTEPGKAPITWNHFHGDVSSTVLYVPNPEQVVGQYNESVAMLRRAFTELKLEAVDTVISLIESNALYRGEEHLEAVKNFRTGLALYESNWNERNRETLLWLSGARPVARFRNTVIGTLVTDLSDGVELEQAVASFEKKVAPENYKRTTALVTPAMIKQATETIEQLGLAPSLERRLAVIGDVNVNDVLWVDNSVRNLMKGGALGALEQMAKDTEKLQDRGEQDISVEDFMAGVVPVASSMEIFMSNGLQNNLVTLTAPKFADALPLFKWDNGFGWSYNGNVTDSIKEKVKRAGGNTGADLRVSLAWFNGDDLDIHAFQPNGEEIYFGNKRGILDVDMNAGGPKNSKDPVENLSWVRPADGKYKIHVHQFAKRSNDNPGFVIEVESRGQVQQFSYNRAAVGNIPFGTLTVHAGQVVSIEVNKDFVGGGISQEVWGVQTEQFVKVNTLMLSPNHWEGRQVGNKHWFFLLDGCRVDTPVRGIYNEYLKADLEKHRKVFEVLGDKTKCPVETEQLSGLGFSSTRGDTVKIRATIGNSTKLYNVKF